VYVRVYVCVRACLSTFVSMRMSACGYVAMCSCREGQGGHDRGVNSIMLTEQLSRPHADFCLAEHQMSIPLKSTCS